MSEIIMEALKDAKSKFEDLKERVDKGIITGDSDKIQKIINGLNESLEIEKQKEKENE